MFWAVNPMIMTCQVNAGRKLYKYDSREASTHTSMPSITFPPFPDDVATHPLLIIDYNLIKARDEGEIDRLWQAGTKLGFW
jgi:hypothetical protein